jgi:hypothetical protein
LTSTIRSSTDKISQNRLIITIFYRCFSSNKRSKFLLKTALSAHCQQRLKTDWIQLYLIDK